MSVVLSLATNTLFLNQLEHETLIENYFHFISSQEWFRVWKLCRKKTIFYHSLSQEPNYKSEIIRNSIIEMNSFELINSVLSF